MSFRPLVTLGAYILGNPFSCLPVDHFSSPCPGAAGFAFLIHFVARKASPPQVAHQVIKPVPCQGHDEKGEKENHGMGPGDPYSGKGLPDSAGV